ncbi:hypothetical protein HYPSUDRAFT_200563 [Hypholoma sublateritium FD-334 SS-4]|uniref:Uncharacterized protein n=1 Tax=Hypholoma sublateritium (strain FD-334 SS-4) TaxID=945553 RepID=A0A0D2PY43_HYPSF|nr:hypothetical protein HYPSUDRAFT_200563 [Hypholoma sublateritium FD-334 SS-4]
MRRHYTTTPSLSTTAQSPPIAAPSPPFPSQGHVQLLRRPCRLNVSPPTHTAMPKPSAVTATSPTAPIRDVLAAEGAAPSTDDGPMQQLAASVAPTQLVRLAGDYCTRLDPRRPPSPPCPCPLQGQGQPSSPSPHTPLMPPQNSPCSAFGYEERPAVSEREPGNAASSTQRPTGCRRTETTDRVSTGGIAAVQLAGTVAGYKESRRRLIVPPGLSEVEAAHTLGRDAAGWACPAPPAEERLTGAKRKAGAGLNSGCVIPSFDDGLKARLMDEIAYMTDGELRSPLPKQVRMLRGRTRTRRRSCPRRPLCQRCRLGFVRSRQFAEGTTATFLRLVPIPATSTYI